MPKCGFCPAEVTSLTGEHIWDDWLNKYLPTKRYRAKHRRTDTRRTFEFELKRLNQKFAAACGSCNNTWMSDISNEVRNGFLSAIIDADPLSILPRGCSLLAAYAFLKASAYDYAHVNVEPFFFRAARERFAAFRSIPRGVQVWVGAFQGEAAYSGRCISRHTLSSTPPFDGCQWLTLTYVVGHIALQLLAGRWQQIHRRGLSVPEPCPDPVWDKAMLPIWPLPESPVSWPPPAFLDDETGAMLVDRFSKRVRLRIA